MGFSFSGIRKELDSKELGKLYKRLQADCLYLAPFSDWKAVVAFLHDQKRGYRLKDRILWRLIQYYRQGGDCERLGAIFLAIFEPAILGLYSFWRSRYPYLGNDDLFQEICLTLLDLLKEIQITSRKVAGKIDGTLKNRIQAVMDRHADEALIHSDIRPFSTPPSIDDTSGSVKDEFFDVGKVLDILGVSDMRGLLNLLARRRVIDREEKRILDATLIAGKTLKEIARPGEYERLKYRRKNALKAIRSYLLRILQKD